MQSHELLKDILQKISAKQISAEMGLSLSLIYKWAEPAAEGSGAANPLDRIEQLLKLTGDRRLAHWVCERAGGFFIANPRSKTPAVQLIPATNTIVQQVEAMKSMVNAFSEYARAPLLEIAPFDLNALVREVDEQ